MSFEINIQKKAPPKNANPLKAHRAFAQDDDDEAKPKANKSLKAAMPFLVNEIAKANEEKVRIFLFSKNF